MLKSVLALALAVALVPFADARGRSSSPGPSSPRSTPRSVSTQRSSPRSAPRASRRSSPPKCTTCARDSSGRIARSSTARRDFQKARPCPATGKTSGSCPGYVIDHVVPLKRGVDSPGNMQWQTKAAAKAKDKIE
jgi:hypothetical protein